MKCAKCNCHAPQAGTSLASTCTGSRCTGQVWHAGLRCTGSPCRCPHMRRLKGAQVLPAYRCQQRYRLKGAQTLPGQACSQVPTHSGSCGSDVQVSANVQVQAAHWSGVFAGARTCTDSRCTGLRCPGPCPGPVGHFPLACQAGWGAALILSFAHTAQTSCVWLCETQLCTLSCVLGVKGLESHC